MMSQPTEITQFIFGRPLRRMTSGDLQDLESQSQRTGRPHPRVVTRKPRNSKKNCCWLN